MPRVRLNIILIFISVLLVGLIVSVMMVNRQVSMETEKSLYYKNNIIAHRKRVTPINKKRMGRDSLDDGSSVQNNLGVEKEKQKIFYEIPVDEPVLIQ